MGREKEEEKALKLELPQMSLQLRVGLGIVLIHKWRLVILINQRPVVQPMVVFMMRRQQLQPNADAPRGIRLGLVKRRSPRHPGNAKRPREPMRPS